jgi:hypothetical protein
LADALERFVEQLEQLRVSLAGVDQVSNALEAVLAPWRQGLGIGDTPAREVVSFLPEGGRSPAPMRSNLWAPAAAATACGSPPKAVSDPRTSLPLLGRSWPLIAPAWVLESNSRDSPIESMILRPGPGLVPLRPTHPVDTWAMGSTFLDEVASSV